MADGTFHGLMRAWPAERLPNQRPLLVNPREHPLSAYADPLFDLEGRVVLVAGGAGGLGEPIARALAERGARVSIADVDEKRARDVAASLGKDSLGLGLDVVSGTSCDAVMQALLKRWGHLDGLVNASGVYKVGPALELADAAWELSINVNLTGAFRLARAAGRVMVPQRSGSIVTIASVSSFVANPNYAAYAASKAGVLNLTRVLAVEWATTGVRVNAIGPAVTPTPLAQPVLSDPILREKALARIPMGRFGTPEDQVGAVVFLLSAASVFMTGQILYVDGGRTLS
jgi:NAD(P)-dependent dehydrogenase (short-subunit alcohol dehydrogenase family)